MLPLGGPEFWLQAELQDALDRIVKDEFRDVLAVTRAPYPSVELSARMTSSAGRCYPDSGVIRIATLYHRDHGIDQTLLVLKHELAHWAARWQSDLFSFTDVFEATSHPNKSFARTSPRPPVRRIAPKSRPSDLSAEAIQRELCAY